jgi:hypothetical protein
VAVSSATEVRIQLLRAGFAPLPADGKKVFLEGWSAKTNTNECEIRLWEKVYPHWTNTSVLTKFTPAIDIDITNPEATDAVEDLARERFSERGRFMVRFGKAPKRAVLFRTAAPFGKIATTFTAAGGATSQRVEVLGDGQQIVVDGIHPDTRAPYRWHGGQPGEVPRRDLPDVTADEARAFVANATELLRRDFGYRTATPAPRLRNDASTPGARDLPGWTAVISADVAEGGRNDTVAWITGHLLRRGVNAAIAHEFMLWWNVTRCKPPLPEEEVTRAVNSICTAELRRREFRRG